MECKRKREREGGAEKCKAGPWQVHVGHFERTQGIYVPSEANSRGHVERLLLPLAITSRGAPCRVLRDRLELDFKNLFCSRYSSWWHTAFPSYPLNTSILCLLHFCILLSIAKAVSKMGAENAECLIHKGFIDLVLAS